MLEAFLLMAALQGQDPVQVRARLRTDEIQAGATTVLRVDVETDGERARIDRFRSLPPGIELQGTRDYDQRQFSLPGGTRRFVSREFIIRALAPGQYRIPSVDVEVGGRTYSTSSTILRVVASPTRPRGELPGESEDGVILRAWLDADTVFVGEQVTLEAEAMFSQQARLRLRRAPEYEPPSPSGFWIHELPDGGRLTTRSVGRDVFEVQRFRRVFFPLSPGDYEIPPARLEYEIRRGLLYAPETRELTSDPLSLVVLPIPPPQPPSFTGAVGSYTMRGWLEPARVPAGEAAVLTVEIDGEGNVKALPPPSLPEMEGIDVFPPGEEAEIETRGAVVRGSKRFSWVLIPRLAGTLEIPEIRYAYFDPDAGGFETVSVPALTLEVTPGSATSATPTAATVRYLDTTPGPGDPLGWVRSSWFAALQVLPLLVLATAHAWRRGLGRGAGASRRALRRRRSRRLRELENRAGNHGSGIFAEVESFGREWLADRLSLSARETGTSAALERAGVSAETAGAIRALLDRLSAARYAPVPPGMEARRDMVRALGRLLDRADQEAPMPKRGPQAAAGVPRGGGAAGSTAWILLLLLGSVAIPSSSAARVPAPSGPVTGAGPVDQGGPAAGSIQEDEGAVAIFRAGIEAFDDERYMDAADAFNRYVQLRGEDPAGWYNLGTAYHRAGYPGYAAWAWLKVPALDPRNRDVRHNLRITGVAPELVHRAAPPLPLRTSEILLLAALAWLTSAVAGSLWLLRRGTGAAVTTAVAFIAALGLAASGWRSTWSPETLIVLETANLRAGPTLRAEPVARLEPATGLVPVQSLDGWVRARTLRGDEGWIEIGSTGTL